MSYITEVHDARVCSSPACPCHQWAQRDESTCTDIDLVLQSLALPNFDADWKQAPRSCRNYVEQSVAEYWWLKGKQAGERAAIVEVNDNLKLMMEGMQQ